MAPTEANVLQITNMGFNRQQAFNALTQSNNNLENAINFVINEEAQGGAQGGGQTGVASQTMYIYIYIYIYMLGTTRIFKRQSRRV